MSQRDHRGVTAIWADPSGQFAAMFPTFEHIPAHKHPHKSFVITKVAAVKPLCVIRTAHASQCGAKG